jgi:hypothetical protein
LAAHHCRLSTDIESGTIILSIEVNACIQFSKCLSGSRPARKRFRLRRHASCDRVVEDSRVFDMGQIWPAKPTGATFACLILIHYSWTRLPRSKKTFSLLAPGLRSWISFFWSQPWPVLARAAGEDSDTSPLSHPPRYRYAPPRRRAR